MRYLDLGRGDQRRRLVALDQQPTHEVVTRALFGRQLELGVDQAAGAHTLVQRAAVGAVDARESLLGLRPQRLKFADAQMQENSKRKNKGV